MVAENQKVSNMPVLMTMCQNEAPPPADVRQGRPCGVIA